jgi:UDP-N-acetylglucosamine 2-epimerase (non-hydrolysing)
MAQNPKIKKVKVMTLVGTRPEIIKLSQIMKELDKTTEHVLVHTGQNYDYELNEVFFNDLGLRKPDHFLSAAGKTSSETVGNVITAMDRLFEDVKPDALLVLGDTNSAMGAYAAKRRKIPIFHMEAGNRCFDARVPEEVNRKLLDHMSDINLVYSDVTRLNLLREGLPMDRIIKSGSPTYEVLLNNKKGIEGSKILQKLKLQKEKYLVMTLHREENVNIKKNFEKEIEIIKAVSERYKMPIIFSCHPRTKKHLDENKISLPKNVIVMKPLGLFDFVKLQINAFCVVTDSGTINEESSMLNFPGVNVRETHERIEAMDEGSVIMTGLNPERVLQSIEIAVTQSRGTKRDFRIPPDYAYPNVSKKMVRVIVSYIDYVKRVVWSE